MRRKMLRAKGEEEENNSPFTHWTSIFIQGYIILNDGTTWINSPHSAQQAPGLMLGKLIFFFLTQWSQSKIKHERMERILLKKKKRIDIQTCVILRKTHDLLYFSSCCEMMALLR